MSIENDGALAPETVTSTVTDAPVENAESTPATPPTESEPGTPPAEPKKKDGGFQRRIDKLTRTVHELRRELDTRTPKQEVKDDSEPKEADFSSYGDYLRAVAKWEIKQSYKAQSQEQQERQQQESFKKTADTFQERSEKLREKYEDFDEVCFGDHVVISEVMSMAILDSEYGPEINYYLGSNPQESLRIAKLSPYAAAREIGKLELKFANPQTQPKKPSNAPDPINPVKPKAPASDGPSSEDDVGTWIQKRRKQVRGNR